MTTTPIFALNIRGKKDALLARQRARRVAGLLSFDIHEQACIAAGAFVIACQALTVWRQARICFQIDNHQLHIFAEAIEAGELPGIDPVSQRLTGLFNEAEAKTLYRLCKPLPAQEGTTDQLDVGWIVRTVEESASGSVFEEIVKQNQEMLTLLHELRLYQDGSRRKDEKTAPPHAA